MLSAQTHLGYSALSQVSALTMRVVSILLIHGGGFVLAQQIRNHHREVESGEPPDDVVHDVDQHATPPCSPTHSSGRCFSAKRLGGAGGGAASGSNGRIFGWRPL